MGRLAAIGGGNFKTAEALNRYALNMTGTEFPKVVFLPTASRDDATYVSEFNKTFTEMGAQVQVLELTKKKYTDAEIDEMFAWADMFYVGGGNTIYMMNVWRKFGIDTRLKEVFASDSAVLAGNGSGCTCWFNCGYSNSQYNDGQTDWQYIWADNMLDFQHAAVCPHYNDEGRSNFDRRLLEKEIPGFALEDNTALIQIGEHTEFIGSHPNAKAFYLIYLNGEMMKKEINLKYMKNAQE